MVYNRDMLPLLGSTLTGPSLSEVCLGRSAGLGQDCLGSPPGKFQNQTAESPHRPAVSYAAGETEESRRVTAREWIPPWRKLGEIIDLIDFSNYRCCSVR